MTLVVFNEVKGKSNVAVILASNESFRLHLEGICCREMWHPWKRTSAKSAEEFNCNYGYKQSKK